MAITPKAQTHEDRKLDVQRYWDLELIEEYVRTGNDWGNVVRTMVEVIADHSSACIICEHAKERDRLIVVDFEEVNE